MTTFIFVRHGKSQANQDDLVSDSATLLTKEGEAQARRVGRELKKEGISIIVSSPYQRAHRTAEIIAKELKIDHVEIIDDLRERGLGDLEGHKHEHKHEWYYSVDGESDVEPRGIVIARCEAALAEIKKLSAQGKVLVVGHTLAGYFLREVAAGKRVLADFSPPHDIANGAYKTVTIVDAPIPRGSRQVAVAYASLVVGFLLLIVGIWLLMNRPTTPPESVTTESIPLSPEDYNNDPLLQKAVEQQLQQQTQSGQSGTDASGALQPAAQNPIKQ